VFATAARHQSQQLHNIISHKVAHNIISHSRKEGKVAHKLVLMGPGHAQDARTSTSLCGRRATGAKHPSQRTLSSVTQTSLPSYLRQRLMSQMLSEEG